MDFPPYKTLETSTQWNTYLLAPWEGVWERQEVSAFGRDTLRAQLPKRLLARGRSRVSVRNRRRLPQKHSPTAPPHTAQPPPHHTQPNRPPSHTAQPPTAQPT